MKGFGKFLELTRSRLLSHTSSCRSSSCTSIPSSSKAASISLKSLDRLRVTKTTSSPFNKHTQEHTRTATQRHISSAYSSSVVVTKAQHTSYNLPKISILDSHHRTKVLLSGSLSQQHRTYTSTTSSFEDRENFIAGVGLIGILVFANALVASLESNAAKKGMSVIRGDFGPSKTMSDVDSSISSHNGHLSTVSSLNSSGISFGVRNRKDYVNPMKIRIHKRHHESN